MKVHVIYNPNGKGEEVRIHKAGCSDIPREIKGLIGGRRGRPATSHYSSAFETRQEAAEDFWADFIDEGSMTTEEALAGTYFAPCAKDLP